MHRKYLVLRLLGFAGLLAGLLAYTSIQPSLAQDKIVETPVIIMTVGSTQTYQASSKENLKSVVNPNGNVLQVTRLINRFDTVLFEAKAPGRTHITLVDVNDKQEFVDIIVINERVKDLREMINRAVPNSAVTVISSDSGTSVVLTGTVRSVEDAKTVHQIAGQLYGLNVVNNLQIAGVQQVQLEVIVASVDRSRARDMSFSWVNNQNSWFLGSIFPGQAASNFASSIITAAAGAAPTQSALTQTPGSNIPFGVLTNGHSFIGFLQALNTEGLTKLYAEPRVVTLSGRPATVVNGGEVPILTASGVGAPSVSYKQIGTVVTCLPIVKGNGKIYLEVRPEITTLNTANSISIAGTTPTSVPGFNTQSAQVSIEMEDGQTLMIGGLVQNNVTSTIGRVPILGDLPFLGWAFTSKTDTFEEVELMILVTVRLVDPVDCTKIPHLLPGRETRVPSDFEYFCEGILEAPRGPRNVSLHPHEYKAAYLYGPTASQFPCNDQTGCAGCGRPGYGCANGNCANGSCGLTNVGAVNANLNPAPAPVMVNRPVQPNTVRVSVQEEGMSTAGSSNFAAERDGMPVLGPVTAPGSSSYRDVDYRQPPVSFGRAGSQ